MMSYEFWVKQLLDVMELIADRNYQVRRWLAPDSHAWEHPGSLMVDVFDAFTFDLFIEIALSLHESSQLTACERLKREATTGVTQHLPGQISARPSTARTGSR